MSDEGIYFCGFIPLPERETIPGSGSPRGKSDAERNDQLHQWIKEANKRYNNALGAYTKFHLGPAQLEQEDVEEDAVRMADYLKPALMQLIVDANVINQTEKQLEKLMEDRH